tara:strand:+ start:96 stop:506 length:411 start_codon:yes stop_codon:yes gene_type:complete
MAGINKIFNRIRKNTIGAIMIDETYRQISSRESGAQYQQYINSRRAEIAQLKKEEFETSLRESQSPERSKSTDSGLFGANNIFKSQLVKDATTVTNLNRRKHKMKEEMIEMIGNLNEKDFASFESSMIAFNLSNPR